MRRKQRKHEDHKKEAIDKKSSAKVQSVEKVSIQDVHPVSKISLFFTVAVFLWDILI